MIKIYSQVEPERLLHVVFDGTEPLDSRTDLSDPQEWLQVSVLNFAPAKTVGPHLHNAREQHGSARVCTTQEAWIVLRGEITAGLFDLDHRPLGEETLLPGHVLVTFGGGHSLQCGRLGAMLVECKNGPYLGRDHTSF
ncbi:MAG: hypothetical protein K1X67_18525 [Fimbriimonadaceae bacterium]|nr:hypothetical protein [Fimbriimonadaceae bacterium]